MLDDFSQLAVMQLYFPVIAAKLREVGQNGDWIMDMTAVEKTLRGGGAQDGLESGQRDPRRGSGRASLS
jgi:hypothetical protein